ncbi:MAG: hypothetical protein KKD39_04380 [Candidatus Altiarchaeota archaeon]|nr:hypothetical protein [Candidatus Altiarchaeota archaeon]
MAQRQAPNNIQQPGETSPFDVAPKALGESGAYDVIVLGELLEQVQQNRRQQNIVAALTPENVGEGLKLSLEDRLQLLVDAVRRKPDIVSRAQQQLLANIAEPERKAGYTLEMRELNGTMNRLFSTKLLIPEVR